MFDSCFKFFGGETTLSFPTVSTAEGVMGNSATPVDASDDWKTVEGSGLLSAVVAASVLTVIGSCLSPFEIASGF